MDQLPRKWSRSRSAECVELGLVLGGDVPHATERATYHYRGIDLAWQQTVTNSDKPLPATNDCDKPGLMPHDCDTSIECVKLGMVECDDPFTAARATVHTSTKEEVFSSVEGVVSKVTILIVFKFFKFNDIGYKFGSVSVLIK